MTSRNDTPIKMTMGQRAVKSDKAYSNRERQERLILLLPKHGFKIAPAAREAGYSESYANTKLACNLRKDVEFNQRMNALRAENLGINDDKVAAADNKLQNLIDNVEMTPATMIKALELFFRRHGALADKQIIETAERERDLSRAMRGKAKQLALHLMKPSETPTKAG